MRRLDDYKDLLKAFLNAGYSPMPFVEQPPQHGALLLRHDVDFDVALAEKIAALENEMKVQATYFFMLTSASYNVLDQANRMAIYRIREMGHQISLHFDPSVYDDFILGLKMELEYFKMFFGERPSCISIHRPNDYFINNDCNIEGVRHTYQSRYSKEIKYFSDSQGQFRYGHPLASDAFLCRQSIQLLIHPVWWVTDGCGPHDILERFLRIRISKFQQHIAKNCIPYRDIIGNTHEMEY